MPTTLLLFDIDGTLIIGSRAARAAFARAIHICLGVEVDLSTLQSAGKTDPRIMQEIIDEHGLHRGGVDWEALRAAFLAHFADAVRLDPGRVGPGVRPLLEALSRRAGTVLALGTGNLQESARMKLAAHGLDAYFDTGGFGDDSPDRDALIAAGIARVQARRRTSFDRVVVVGDTPFDVACARANRAHSLAVATGPFDLETLRRAGATLAVADFSETDVVVAAVDALLSTNHRARSVD